MEEQNNLHEYRTGRTHPRKNNSGPVAVLLIAVIFLTGLVSALGLLNIRLFRELENKNSISFSPQSAYATNPADTNKKPSLGMTFQEISLQYQIMYDLPGGLYISQVHNGSSAEAMGIRVGDVLMAFENIPVHHPDALDGLLYAHNAGDRVQITLYRSGRLYNLTMTVDQAE